MLQAAGAIFDRIVKGGPWALVVVIVLVWLAGEYGYLESQSKLAADGIRDHARQTEETQRKLDRVINVLEQQWRVQTEAALIACIRGAKTDSEQEACVRKFPVERNP